MAKKEPLKVPTKTFTVNGRQYRFLIPQFHHGEVLTAEECLDKPEVLEDLVNTLRIKEGKPEVSGGVIALVEEGGSETKEPATKQPNVADTIALINAAKSEDEIDAITAGDTRKTVLDAAEKAKKALAAK